MDQIFKNLEDILSYSRITGNEARIRSFLEYYFKLKWFKTIVDDGGNLIVYIPAKNSDSQKTYILHSNLDMIWVKKQNFKFDFLLEQLETFIEWDRLFGENMSIWAKSLIWISTILSIIENDYYPNMELLFTIWKEKSLMWSQDLDKNLLKWEILINLNHYIENEIVISWKSQALLEFNKKFELEELKTQRFRLKIFNVSWWNAFVSKEKINILSVFLDFLKNNQYLENIYEINSGEYFSTKPIFLEIIFDTNSIKKFKSSLSDFIWNIIMNYDETDIETKITKIIDTKDVSYKIKDHLKEIWELASHSNLWQLKYIEWNLYSQIAFNSNENSLENIEKLVEFLDENNYDYNLYDFSNDFELKDLSFIEKIKNTLPNYNIIKFEDTSELWNIFWWNIKTAFSLWINILNIDAIGEEINIKDLKKLKNDVEKILKL